MTDLLAERSANKISARRAVTLLGVGTAAPPSGSLAEAIRLTQSFSCQTAGQRAWLERVFSRSGVEWRGSVLMGANGVADVERFYAPPAHDGDRGPTTAVRMARYVREAPVLAQRAAQAALADAGVMPAEITHLITVSCTGFRAPGLDVEMIQRLALSPAVRRLHIGFMGCHAAFNALTAARDIVLAHPGARVLVCSVELSTLHFAYGWNPEKLVANALFADGSSACVVGAAGAGAGEGRWRLLQTASLLLPESADAMTWQIGDHGFEMTLSAELPALIRGHLRAWCEAWLAEEGLTLGEITHWAIHPGGPKIISAAAEALGLAEKATAASRAVLAAHGNMSSATLLFLLEQIAADSGGPGYGVALGFGPGLMAEGLLLEK